MLTLKAPAKINLFLNVLGLRDDGFHKIQSLIQKVTLYDILTIKPAEDFILRTDPSISTRQNLVYKAARLLKEICGVRRGAHIYLKKHIPISSGLGGGSSDAAAALSGLNKLWGLNLSKGELHDLALRLGSDVPFFLDGPLAFVEGRGEKITALKMTRQLDILLVKPHITVSTAWAYSELSLQSSGLTKKDKKVDNIEFFIRGLKGTRLQLLKGRAILGSMFNNFSNDLEAPVVRRFPVIADIKKRLLEEGAIFSMMSGSGSTVFGVFSSKEEAYRASLAFKGFWTAMVRTII